jgi:beta-lactam-binding protein with PASTA domain
MNDRLPEEQDLEFEELITVLRQADLNPSLIDPTEYGQIISKARARLFHTDAGVFRYEDMPTDKQRGLVSLPSKPNANRDRPHPRRRLLRLARVLAAVLVVVAVLGAGSTYVGYSVITSRSGSPTPTVILETVPDLSGMTWQDASNAATHAGFKLTSQDGSTDGVVVQQNPKAGEKASSGSTLEVLMGVQKATVPTIPQNSSLATIELILSQSGFAYTVQADGTNPNLQPNTVSRISPTSGSSVAVGTKITIYVVNSTYGTPSSHIEPNTASSW